MATKTLTKGVELTSALRKAHHIGPRTRWSRDGWTASGKRQLREDLLDRIDMVMECPDTYPADEVEAIAPVVQILYLWDKYVTGRRINDTQATALERLSPWQWTAILGEMVDADIRNGAEAEMWFQARRDAA